MLAVNTQVKSLTQSLHKNLKETMHSTPFFIVSSGRSGTTFLRIVLNSNPEIFIPGETDFPVRSWPYFNKCSHLTDNDYAIIAQIFKSTSAGHGWNFNTTEVISAFGEKNATNIRECIDAILAKVTIRDKPGARYLGVKRPNLIFHIDRLWQIYPDAKVLHLIRDGRDVSLSYINAHNTKIKFGPQNIASAAFYWRTGISCARRHLKDPRLMTIKYEELLVDFLPSMKKISRFLDLPYDEKIYEEYHKQERPKGELSASVVSSIHSNVHKGVMTNNYDKHLREMSPWQARIFECIAGDVLADQGYRLRHPSSLPAAWLIRLLLDAPLRWLNTWRYARREKRILNVATSQAMQGRQP